MQCGNETRTPHLGGVVQVTQAGVGESHGGYRGERQQGVGLQGNLSLFLPQSLITSLEGWIR